AGKLGQDEHALLLDAGGAVFLGDEIHAVFQRSHERDVGGAVIGQEIAAAQASVYVPDGHPTAWTHESAVDLADELLDLHLEIVVLRDIHAARHHDLDERHALAQIGIAIERVAKCLQTVRDAFRIVETIDPEYQLA